jgi:lipopolysaccharide/colanic/teichoic acid biosynthesis glycosyltransferase
MDEVGMSIRSIISRVFTGACPVSKRRIDGVHSEEVFMAILAHERAVAERNGLAFSVLAFGGKDRHVTADSARILGGVLAERLRTTDVTGWMNAGTIGVLMPHTRFRDALSVAEHICRKALESGAEFAFRVYLYPHEEYGKGGQKEFSLISGGAGGSSASLAGNPGAGHPSSGFHAASVGDSPAEPLEMLFIEPLPAWKRMVDIALSLVGILLWAPGMLLIAAAIKVVSPGPVFFRQERIGFMGKKFVLFKFRSMRLDAEQQVHKSHLAKLMKGNSSLTKLDKADSRLIPFGRFFRASGLDELPQLFNILRGDMSLIGPRPCVPYEYEQFARWHKRRFDTHPGLTGLWQVSGKNKTTFTEMMRLDIAYARKRSLLADLRILFRTVPAVVGQVAEMAERKR